MSTSQEQNQGEQPSQAPNSFREARSPPRLSQLPGSRPGSRANGRRGHEGSSNSPGEGRGSANDDIQTIGDGDFRAGRKLGYAEGHEDGFEWGYEVGYNEGYYEGYDEELHGQSQSQAGTQAENNTGWAQNVTDSQNQSQSTYPNITITIWEFSNRSNGRNGESTRGQDYRDYFEKCKGFEEDDSQWIPNIKE